MIVIDCAFRICPGVPGMVFEDRERLLILIVPSRAMVAFWMLTSASVIFTSWFRTILRAIGPRVMAK